MGPGLGWIRPNSGKCGGCVEKCVSRGCRNGHSARDSETIMYDPPVPWVWVAKAGNDGSTI